MTMFFSLSHRKLKHSNVLLLFGVVTNAPAIMVILENCSLGNLKTYLVTRRREASILKNNGHLVKLAKDMAAGLGYLHTMSIAHK